MMLTKQLNFNKLFKTYFSTVTNLKKLNVDVKKVVYVSNSHDIYTNLALEDWIYKNVDCQKQHILMLWSNNPCVVIGRHQNPWMEANVNELNDIIKGGVKLARRNSGGGTVYHDRGNLNLTFFTPRERYNRKENLQFIQQVLQNDFNLLVEINKREDLVFNEKKISGTAAKLGRLASYHHCTLLVNANKANLSRALKKPMGEIKTNATQSVKSSIMNLQEENPQIGIENLLIAMGRQYLQNFNEDVTKSFALIEPNEQSFPGFNKLKEDLISWDWIYGKTPKFTISRSFTVPSNFVESTGSEELKIAVFVENGLIQDIQISLPLSFMSQTFDQSFTAINSLKGYKYTSDVLENLEDWIKEGSLENDLHSKFLVDCFRKIVINSS